MDCEKLLEIDRGFVEGFWVEHMKPEWMNSHVLDKCVDKPDSACSSQKKNQDIEQKSFWYFFQAISQ